ncbi:hypothetical protein JOS77_28810 [Chromobacterium haemolyticum]|nr:hypothetical protein JOS77_28810 [Chromobacterium haemolyticum]
MENFQAKPGEAFGGGFYVGRFHVGSAEYALIVAPKSVGEIKGTWGEPGVEIPGAHSCCDGAANTKAMAEAGSELASVIAGLDINGFSDWHMPSRDEVEMCFRYLKPTPDENYCTFRDGDNPSSIPVGYPYPQSKSRHRRQSMPSGQGVRRHLILFGIGRLRSARAAAHTDRASTMATRTPAARTACCVREPSAGFSSAIKPFIYLAGA